MFFEIILSAICIPPITKHNIEEKFISLIGKFSILHVILKRTMRVKLISEKTAERLLNIALTGKALFRRTREWKFVYYPRKSKS